MMTDWQLAEAKNNFNQVMNQALTSGPQRIRRRNEAVVVISEAEYQRLTGERITFLEFLLEGPDLCDLDLSRDQSLMRELEL
jgi:antitoxin Phd